MRGKHTHRAITASSVDYCWSHCVTPDECAARPARQVAHGGIVRVDVCRCGAVRHAEINAGRTNYGPWHHPGAD